MGLVMLGGAVGLAYTVSNATASALTNVVGFALVGLSDTANLVGFYENGGWQVRLAYNWRDEFLSGLFDGQGPNPNYTEAYSQLDATVSYQFNDNLTLQLEAINLTDETQRIHGRHQNQVLFATQTGPRYMFGLRYKF
jgi:outer membrane receptor protein involved in Fe transport